MKKIIKMLFFMFLFIFSVGVSDKAFAEEYLITPTNMTSDTAPAPFKASSSSIDERYSQDHPWRAFNGTSDSWLDGWFSASGAISNEWLAIDIGIQKIPSSYSFSTWNSDLSAAPKDWTFEGSNDGVNWKVLDTKTNISNWSVLEEKKFAILNNVNSYSKFRINVASNNGRSDIAIDNFKIYSDSTFVLATNVLLSATSLDMIAGSTEQLVATIIPDNATNKGVTWSTSDSNIATVDSNGNITALSEGIATITATTQDGSNLSASCTVNVTKQTTPMPGITLNKTSNSIIVGQTDNLVATTTSSSVLINWSSSNSSIATVDSNGKVTGIKEGQATITATTVDGLTATCVINVTSPTGPIEPEPTEAEYIINTARAKGDNTNNASGEVSIIFKGIAEAQLSVVKTADVDSVYVGDNFTYTIVVTNTSSKIAKAVVINDSAPNHIDFIVNGVTTTQGKVDPSSTSKNIVVNVGDIAPLGTVTIKVPATVFL